MLANTNTIFAQQIDSNFAGQNAWMAAVCNFDGTVGDHLPDIKKSGAKFIRIGGIGYDKCLRRGSDFDTFNIPALINKGLTPIVQLSYYDTASTPQPQVWTDPNEAAQHLLINVVTPLYNQGVRYFSIGNEPNNTASNSAYTAANTNGHPQNFAQGIYDYISAISTTIRGTYNAADGDSVFLLGPELSFYDKKLIDTLTSIHNILPFIDKFTFHYYPFGNEQNTAAGYQIAATRDNIINVLREGTPVYFATNPPEVVTPLETRLDSLNTIINNFNSSHTHKVSIAITEANLCYKNDVDSTNSTPGTDTSVSGNGTNGYLAGQFWAELMAVAMSKSVSAVNFWSVIEGSSQDNYATDIGYISSQTGKLKSTYHHFKMVAQNFKGEFKWGEIIPGTSHKIKVFASNNNIDGIAVMVMNQDSTGGRRTVKINLDGGNIPGMGNAVKVNVDFGINNFYSAKIKEQETLLILFDATGNFLKKFTYNIQDNISSTSAAPKALIIKKQASIGSNREFKIHPNPVTDNLNIDLPLNSAKHAIVILDITGRVIKQVQVLPNQKTVSVNTSNLSSGTYFLKIQSVAENVSLKFMKQ